MEDDFIVITGQDKKTIDMLHQVLEKNGYTYVSLLERPLGHLTARHKRGD